jgi:uncharacterized protein YndB with AHSA1/START domain
MDQHLKSQQAVSLNTTPMHLWEILTQGAYSKQYMYNCVVESDWQVGSPITWKGHYQGYDAFQKGEILEITPLQRIKFTTFDPNYGMEDIPKNYIHVTYQIASTEESTTQLIVTNETFDGNDERMQHINDGWKAVLAKIEEIVNEENAIK